MEDKRINAKVDAIQRKGKIYWLQRSRVKRLKAGDRNTKFFHSTTMQRRQVNKIVKLNSSSVWITEEDQIKAHVTEYFNNLFFHSGPHDFEEVLRVVPTCITDEMNSFICQSIMDVEITKAVF